MWNKTTQNSLNVGHKTPQILVFIWQHDRTQNDQMGRTTNQYSCACHKESIKTCLPQHTQMSQAKSHLCSMGPALPHLLHCLVFLPAPAWELFLVGNQCDDTRSLKPNIQVGITFISPKLIDGVPSHVKGAWSYQVSSHRFPTRKSPCACEGRKTMQWKSRGRSEAKPNTNVI